MKYKKSKVTNNHKKLLKVIRLFTKFTLNLQSVLSILFNAN